MASALKQLFIDSANAIRETLVDEGKIVPLDIPDKIREVASVASSSVTPTDSEWKQFVINMFNQNDYGTLTLPEEIVTIQYYKMYFTRATKVIARNCQNIGDKAFYNSKNLTTIDIKGGGILLGDIVGDCSKFTALILRNTEKVTIVFGSSNAATDWGTFENANSNFYVYVPASMVSMYKNDENWIEAGMVNRIRAIEDYPDICNAD